jgi:signal transduction histidine kinase
MQNLIANAIKFSEGEVPAVRVTASADGAQACVSVFDNGIGIDPEHAQRIFRPFQRLHSSDRYEGSGIGLAICERIVARHGGRIWAEGTPGEGSIFHFTLPLVRPAATAGDSAAATSAAPVGQ